MIDSLTELVDAATKSPICLISGRNPASDNEIFFWKLCW